ncbi:hypothetical protein D9M70_386610 [compost metagenome]
MQRLANRHRLPRCQRMSLGDDHRQLVAPVRKGLQFGAKGARREDADIRGILGHGAHDGGGDTFIEMDVDARIIRQERLELRRQELRDGRDVGEYPDLAAQAAAVVAHARHDVVEVVQHAARQVNQLDAGRGRLHALVAAPEQGRAEPLLQLADAFADRGRGQVRPLGSGGDGAVFRHADEEAQRDRIESHVVVLPRAPATAPFLCSCPAVADKMRG